MWRALSAYGQILKSIQAMLVFWEHLVMQPLPVQYEVVFYVDVGLDWGCASELSNPRIDGTWENAK